MDPLEKARIGQTGVEVTRIGLGGAAIGGLYATVAEGDAADTVVAALEMGVAFLDTAPYYGFGSSEMRFGRALAGRDRGSYALSTKVGRYLVPDENPVSVQFHDVPKLRPVYDYTRDGVLRSIEGSLERLGLDRIDIVLIHDLDQSGHSYEEALEGACATLSDLRGQGVIGAYGTGLNVPGLTARFVRDCDLDVCLLAGRYTLLDQTALDEALPAMEERGVSMVLGGPYNSGILASDLADDATFDYETASAALVDKARRIKAVCDRHDVPLKAAALQFPLAHPVVASAIPGARSVAEVRENLAMAAHPIPGALWDELRDERLIPASAPTPE